MSSTSSPSVSILGTGLMGAAIARAFLKKSYRTTVWNRSSAKAEALVAQGAVAATTAAEAIQASDLILAVLLDSAALETVLQDIDVSMAAGRTMVDLITGTPTQVRSSAAFTKKSGFAAYIHGAIMSMPAHAGAPEVIFWYSGHVQAFQASKTALEVLGTPMFLDDDPVSASLRETILVNTFYGVSAGIMQSLALFTTTKEYHPGAAEKFMSDVLRPFVINLLEAYSDIARQIDRKSYVTKGDGARLIQQITAIRNIVQTNKEQGLNSRFLDGFMTLMEKRIAQGGGEEEMSGMIEVIKSDA